MGGKGGGSIKGTLSRLPEARANAAWKKANPGVDAVAPAKSSSARSYGGRNPRLTLMGARNGR